MSPDRVNRREFLTWLAAAVAVPPKSSDSALILRRSKDEPLAQDSLSEDERFGSWFDKLTTSGCSGISYATDQPR